MIKKIISLSSLLQQKNYKSTSSLLLSSIYSKNFYSSNNNNVKTIQNIKGTYDFFPNEKKQYDHVNNIGRNIAETFGFKEISTPIIEPSELFNRTVGEGSDIVMKEMYTFNDLSGSSISLRPEGTAGLIRAIINEGSTNHLTPTQRYYYCGPMFRYERPQRGRQRQFEQFGIELIGDEHERSDVEIIDLAKQFIDKLGITTNNNVVLKINTLGDKQSISKYNQVLEQFYREKFNQLSTDSQNRFTRKNFLRILDSKEHADIQINKFAPSLHNHLSKESSERFKGVLQGLDNLGIKYQIDQSLVRGLDYYSHTIFEFIVKQQQQDNGNGSSGQSSPPLTILGGGRYDGLACELGYKGKDSLPSIGWACGVDRILLYIDKNQIPISKRPIGITVTDSKLVNNALKICSNLRKSGFPTMLSSYKLDEESFSKQLKKIIKQQDPKFVLIFAPDEFSNNQVIIKDIDNNTQIAIKIDEINNYLILNY